MHAELLRNMTQLACCLVIYVNMLDDVYYRDILGLPYDLSILSTAHIII